MLISIVCPVTRGFTLLLANLDKIIQPPHAYELIVGIDDRRISAQGLFDGVEKLPNKHLVKGCEVIETKKTPSRPGDVVGRRRRIADIHNLMKESVSGEYVLGIEDDTVLDINPVPNLMAVFNRQPHTGFVEGVQVGRWHKNCRYIGAWMVDDLDTPSRYLSIPGERYPLTRTIDAGGLYCFLTPSSLYKEHEFTVTEVGPDINYGLWLRRRGLQCWIRFGLPVGHQTDKECLWPDDIHTLEWYRDGRRWLQKITSPKKTILES